MIEHKLSINADDFTRILRQHLDLDEDTKISAHIQVPGGGDYSNCRLYLDEVPLTVTYKAPSHSDTLLIAAAREKIRDRHDNSFTGAIDMARYAAGVIDMLMEVVEGDFTRDMLRDKIHGK